MRPVLNWKKEHLVLCLIVLAGLLARLQFVNVPAFGDEVQVMTLAASTSERGLPIMHLGFRSESGPLLFLGSPPFPLLVYGGVFNVFGISDIPVRLALVALSIVKILLIYLTCSLFFGRKAALLSTGIFGIAVESVASDVDIYSAPIAYVFILAFAYLFLKGIQKGNVRIAILSVLLGLALFAYIPSSLIVWVSIFLSCILFREHRKNVISLVAILILGISVYVALWLAYILLVGGDFKLFLVPLEHIFARGAASSIGSGIYNISKIVFSVALKPAGLAVPLLFSFVAVSRLSRREKFLAVISAIFVFLVFFMTLTAYSGYPARYIGAAYPFIAIILGVALSRYADAKEIFKYAVIVLLYLTTLFMLYRDKLISYFWISTTTSHFLPLWYLPMLVAFALVLFSLFSKKFIQISGMACAVIFIAYAISSYVAFYMGFPVLSVGGGYYGSNNGLLEASYLAKQHVGQDNFLIAPDDVAYHAGLMGRYLNPFAVLIYDGMNIGQLGDRVSTTYENLGYDAAYDAGLFDQFNVTAVVLPDSAMGMPASRLADVRNRFPNVEKAGTYYVFSR